MYNFIMEKFFDPNNPVTVLLSRIFDLILLNICFVLACIPIITIGPALSALYAVTLRMADGDFGHTKEIFFSSFRRNFRQGMQLWLLFSLSGVFLSADIYVIFFVLPERYRLLQIPVWLLIFTVVSAIIYVFPMLARYEQTNLQLIRNSLLISLGNIPLTVFIIVLTAVILDLALHNGSLMILFFSIFLFIGFALLARLFSVFFKRAFLNISQ